MTSNDVRELDLKLTSACNMNCVYCSNADGRKTRVLNAKKAKQAIAAFPNLQQVSFTGGEPFLEYELLKELVAFAWARRIPTISINNNASICTLEQLRELKSIGLTQFHTSYNTPSNNLEKFTFHRGCSTNLFERVKTSIRWAISLNLYTCVDCCITTYNCGDLERIYDECVDLGVNRFQIQPVMPVGRATENDRPSNPELEKAVRAVIEKRIATKKGPLVQGYCLETVNPRIRLDYSGQDCIDIRACNCGQNFVYLTEDGYAIPSNVMSYQNNIKSSENNFYERSMRGIIQNAPVFRNASLNNCIMWRGKQISAESL